MISNSKSFVIQPFIALIILVSSFTFSVNAYAIAPARFTEFARRGPVGGILNNPSASQAVVNLCSSISSDLMKLEQSSDSSDKQTIKRTLFGVDVVCSGTYSIPDAATVDRPVDTSVDITPQAIADAQTAANADFPLITDITNNNAVSAVQAVCTTIQDFITTDCGTTVTICRKISSIVNQDCINATPTSGQ